MFSVFLIVSSGPFLFPAQTMRRFNINTLLGVLSVCILLYLTLSNIPIQRITMRDSAVNSVRSNYSAWHDCMMRNISSLENNPTEVCFPIEELLNVSFQLWSNLWKGIKQCEVIDEMKGLFIGDYSNSDETKRHIVPKLVDFSFLNDDSYASTNSKLRWGK